MTLEELEKETPEQTINRIWDILAKPPEPNIENFDLENLADGSVRVFFTNVRLDISAEALTKVATYVSALLKPEVYETMAEETQILVSVFHLLLKHSTLLRKKT